MDVQPSVEVTNIFDPASVSSNFEFFDQDLLSLPSDVSLKAQQVIVRLHGVNLIYYSTNVRVRTRPSLHKSHLGFLVFGPNAHGTINGLPIREDTLLAAPAAQSISMVAEPGNESAGFLVPQDELVAHLSAQGQEEVLATLQRVEMRQLETGRATKLFEWAKQLINSAIDQPEMFDATIGLRIAARHDLLEILTSTLLASSSVELERRDRTRLMQSHIVRAAEEYALAHCDESLYVKDLCLAAGVSERSLEYAFRAEMGLSPIAYLYRLRLHKVREALSQTNNPSMSVSSEALRWGFWQFGDFAKNYKECFHELPSDTLRRTQGH